MKAILYEQTGEKKGDIALPIVFETRIRPDIVAKYLEAEKFAIMQPFSSSPKAGKKHSASGIISHKRHDFKGHYGRGISRIPRKIMWRRGTQFYWIGAEVSGTRGGRRSHPPKLIKRLRKINKKEITLAFNSALAATASSDLIISRYESLEKINDVPKIIESLPQKTKDFLNSLKKIFPNNIKLVLKNKKVRAGKGKARGRKYKSNAGLLLIIGKDEKAKFQGLDIKSIQDLTISDLYPLGRLALYTKKAIEDLEQSSKGENKKANEK